MARDPRPRSRALALALLAAVAAAAGGCASPRVVWTPEQLRAELARRAPAHADTPLPLEVSERHVVRAAELAGAGTDGARARRLADALLAPPPRGFGLRYRTAASGGADATLESGVGNCLALSAAFVALARGAGLHAVFVDASDRLAAVRRDHDFVVRDGHVMAAVRTEWGWLTVDFARRTSEFRTFRVLDDLRALAHFYNNRGYERIHLARASGRPVPWPAVQADFELATKVRPGLALAWNNLGIALARQGRAREAALRYRAALSLDPELAAAWNNLGKLHLEAGRADDARRAFARAAEVGPAPSASPASGDHGDRGDAGERGARPPGGTAPQERRSSDSR